MSIKLKNFCVEKMVDNCVVGIFVDNADKKNNLTKNLVEYFVRRTPIRNVYMSVENKLEFGNEVNVARIPNRSLVNHSVQIQERLIETNPENKPIQSILIIDKIDLTSRTNINIFSNVRFYYLTIIITDPQSLIFSHAVRLNISYYFLSGCVNVRQRKLLWERYFSFFPTLNYFNGTIETITKDGYMVLDKMCTSIDISKKVFKYNIMKNHTDELIMDDFSYASFVDGDDDAICKFVRHTKPCNKLHLVIEI